MLDFMQAPAAARTGDGAEPPEAYWASLRAGGRRQPAADFLAHALPRLEAVAWAARTVRDLQPEGSGAPAEGRALRAALFFVQDPTDARRRACFDAAQACTEAGPEVLAAYAAFFSGGSMAPPEQIAVQPPRYASARFAAGAVKSAAAPVRGDWSALDAALDAGAALARDGLDARA